ncbi:MAG TPA: AAA family ATPase [Gaiella sp.]|nr:AAA family ATPase [Gaiella sp.]
MSSGVVGRDAELAVVRGFLASIPEGTIALVLAGDAGVGKTTLWEAGVANADARGFRVLVARPAESETALSFSGIGDLLDPVLDTALASVPAAQRRALSRALVLGDDEGPPPDPHAIGLALLNSLRALAAEEPVVVAIDDVQWLDTASAGGLTYAARRLRSERIGLLLSRRSGLESPLFGELGRSLRADRVASLDVGPLDASALHQVVQSHLGVVLPRPRLEEVCEASGGNPFYALEIVRMLQRSGVSLDGGRRLPVPESLRELVHGRVLALPPQTRDFLLAAAAHAHPTVDAAESASGVGREVGLPPALEMHVVELDGSRIRFTHPLLAAGAYETADRTRRMEIHARLAGIVQDPETRAWHLAASVEAPDATVAEALELAAFHARGRGALRSAALMLERSRDMTPTERTTEALRRAVAAASIHFESGDSRRAEAQLRELIAPLPAGVRRARAMVVLARIRLYEAPAEAAELFAQVIEEAHDDGPTLAVAHEGAAACSLWLFERFDQGLRHSEVAWALAEEIGDDALSADVLMTRLSGEAVLGRTTAQATAVRAEALQESAADRRVLDQPLVSVAEYWRWADRHEPSRAVLLELLRTAHDRGDENAPPFLLFLLGDVERLMGSLTTALEHASRGREAAEQSGQPLLERLNLALEALVHAELGQPDAARHAAEQALAQVPDHYPRLIALEALGHLALAREAAAEAVAHLESCLQFARTEAITEPGVTRFAIDLVEALTAVGRRDDAADLLAWYEDGAQRLDRASARANCLRCRGLLAAEARDLEAALAHYEEALTWHDRAEIPLDRGRTLLALGVTQRRARRRREARATLEAALAIFERIGAALWLERARAELLRISGRAPTAGALTPAEERVALLVAEGKTNREVAAALFLSDRTVEGHLSRIFGKLGLRHRGELARALAARQSQGTEASNTGDSPVSADRVAP